jgi:hypothetical protein
MQDAQQQDLTPAIVDLRGLLGRRLRYSYRLKGREPQEAIYGTLENVRPRDDGYAAVDLIIRTAPNGIAVRILGLGRLLYAQRSDGALELYLSTGDAFPDVACLAWDEAALRDAPPEGKYGWRSLAASAEEKLADAYIALAARADREMRMTVIDDGREPYTTHGFVDVQARLGGHEDDAEIRIGLEEHPSIPGQDYLVYEIGGRQILAVQTFETAVHLSYVDAGEQVVILLDWSDEVLARTVDLGF